jgi:IMP dehydrogenase
MKAFKETLSFDDVLLTPQYSDIESRSQVTISSEMDDKICLDLPIISSPMDTVTEDMMATIMYRAGGMGIIHRYNEIETQARMVYESYQFGTKNLGAAVGMTGDFLKRAMAVVDLGANVLCVDVAHGHHTMMEACLKTLKDKFGEVVHIMAGNVATLEGFNALAEWGADSIRVGIGGGSICSTRLVSGHGIPTFQSVYDCAKTEYDVKIIADGGIKTSGDIVKALAAGADSVLVGSMLAGTDETPGEVFTTSREKKYKVYRGMASRDAQETWRGKSSTPEGVSTTVSYKGSVRDILSDLAGGIKSGFSYSGAKNLTELQSKAKFIKQTNAGQLESSTHIMRRK